MKIEDRPTPVTRAARFMPSQLPAAWNAAQWVVQAHVAENLERQRDALREALEACLAPLQDEYNRANHAGHVTTAAKAFVDAKLVLKATTPTP